jgi:hypothetical protein
MADNGQDYAISGGWFFTETGGGSGNGYAVRDTGADANGNTIKFWSEFQRLGGIATLGYPVAEPYVGPDGFNYQAFQRGILQWRPESQSADLSNTFEQLQNSSKDDWLLEVKGIPKPIADDGSGGDYAKAVATRLGWLTNSAIKSYYLANPNSGAIPSWSQDQSIQFYGLPMSMPEQHGPFITQRFQRFAIQLWTDSVPGMPTPGSVVGVLGGDLAKEAGLLPAAAIQALAASAFGSGHLPILTILLGTGAASAFQQFAGPGDIGVIPAQTMAYFNNEASVVTSKTIGAGFESWQAGQPLLDQLQGRVSYIAYDVEHWPQTPQSEQDNIVGTVQNMSQAVHSRGMKYILVPDRKFDQQYMSQLAPYADIIVLQGQRIEGNPQDFHDQLLPLIQAAKSANPNVKVYASVGTNNGATPASMQAALNTLQSAVDGIGIFSYGDQASINTLQQFVTASRQ